MRRSPFIAIFVIFLVLGFAAGISYAWLVAPSLPTDRSPAHLNRADRDHYIRLVADSFAATGDKAAAARRLAALGDTSSAELVHLITSALRSQEPDLDPARLVALAAALGIDDGVVTILAPSQPLPPVTAQPVSTPGTPSGTNTAAEENRFKLLDRDVICTPEESVRRLEVHIADNTGKPLPGTVVTIRWEDGNDQFLTGFTAGQSAGFADFDMEPGIIYTVSISGDTPSAEDIQVQLCPDGQDGGWRLEFQSQSP